MVYNLKRDPFEQTLVGDKSALAVGGALAAPSTAYIYDWNLLPIGQRLALNHLETYVKYPPLQAPASYNLAQVMEEIQKQQREHQNRAAGRSD
jgi:arylsulfatase